MFSRTRLQIEGIMLTIFLVVVLISFTQQAPSIGKCPDVDGPTPTYYPDPANCSQFFECNHGYPFLIPCPPHTVFDPNVNVCEHSPNGQCIPVNKIVLEKSASNIPRFKLTNFLLAKQIDLQDGASLAKECPKEDGEWPTFVLHPTDCSKYYECSNGRPILHACPSNLLFNEELLTCDLPENVPCPRPSISFKFSKESAVRDGPSIAKECPKEDGFWPTFLIDEKNCSQYYECSHGVPHLKKCPNGLEFDATRIVCDLPSEAGCKINNIIRIQDSDVVLSGPTLGTECPNEDGFYPTFLLHPTDCSKFYECSHGQPFLHVCPSHLQFNAELLTCDLPGNVQCPRDSMYVDFVDEDLQEDGPTLAKECPQEDGVWPTFLIDPNNCSQYYECAHGIPYLKLCPADLKFNPELITCDLAENFECPTNNVVLYESQYLPKVLARRDGPDLAKKCPHTDGKWPTFLISKNNCSQYYECSDGVPVLKECPPGLNFDAKRLVCDLPNVAGCFKNDRPSLAEECPEEDSVYPTFVLHPTNCSDYYECSNGVPLLHVCPSSLQFNPDVLACDLPENFICPQDTLTLYEAQDPEEVIQQDGPTLAEVCPEEDGRWPTFLINRKNCSQYYECSNGVAYLNECPAGLAFDSYRLVCNSTSEARCVDNEFTVLTEDVEIGAAQNGPSLAEECPSEDGMYPTFIIDEHNCSQYYECSHGYPFLIPCPDGMEFNAKELVCDLPSKSGCQAKLFSSFLEEENLDESNIPLTLASKCPEEDVTYPTFLVHPTDCSKYYQCSHGYPNLQTCPFGLYFNPLKLVCDYKENVYCNVAI